MWEVHIDGLRRGTVRLERRGEWRAEFERVAALVRDAVDGLDVAVEHVGSTAVPRLLAKPIVDVAVSAPAAMLGEVLSRLRATPLVDRGNQGEQGGHVFVLVDPDDPEVRQAHVHVVDRASPQWNRYLAFRDRLRHDRNARQAYEALKSSLAAEQRTDRARYTAGKADFIRGVLEGRTTPDG